MVFKNKKQFEDFIIGKCADAVAEAEKKVYEKFNGNIREFYSEYKPEEYIRTGALSKSLKTTGVKRSGNQHGRKVSAEVYFNMPSYRHGFVPIQSGGFGYSYWSDEKIFNTVMTGGSSRLPHGGYASGTAIWTSGIKKLGGKSGIKNLLKQELKKQGL